MQMGRENGGIPKCVAVDFSTGRKPGVKTCRSLSCLEDTKLRRERCIQRHHPPIRFPQFAQGSQALLRNLKVRCLSKGMDTGIGPPRAVDGGPLAEDPPNGLFQGILHGVSDALALPSAKCGAIVGDKQADFHRDYANDRESIQS